MARVPYTGEQFNPHAPPEELAALKALVAKALKAQKWFEFEGPRWAQPLPLTSEACIRLLSICGTDVPQHVRRRSELMSRYGQTMRSLGWRYERMLPFEQYCPQWLATPQMLSPPPDRNSRRKNYY